MLSNKRDIGGIDPQSGGTASDRLDLTPLPSPKGNPWDLKAVGVANDLLLQAGEPTMIPAYLAGGMTFRALRLGMAGNWVTSSAVKTLSSLFARQIGASTLALGGEVAAFTGAHRLALNLANRGDGKDSVASEMAGTGILLASLRSFGFGFGMAGSLLQRLGFGGTLTRGMLSTLGSYTGLLTAQQAEQRLLHPGTAPTGDPFFNAAVSLIHFTAANAVAAHFTPAAWRGMEHSLEYKTQRLLSEKAEQIRNALINPSDGGLAWARVGADVAVNPAPAEDAKTQGLNFMWGWRKRRLPSDPPPSPTEFHEELPPEIKGSADTIDGIIDYADTPFIKTLSQTKITDPEVIDLGVRRLRYILTTSEMESAKSTYLHWILGLGLRKILESKDSAALDQLITMVTKPTPMRDIETFLARHMGGTRLPEPLMGISTRYKRKSDYYETIEKIPLSEEAKKTLWLLLIAQKKGPDESPYYINPHDFFNRLGEVEQMYDYDKWSRVQSIIEKAQTSHLGLLRLKRLYLVLRSELKMERPTDLAEVRGLLGIKLRDLANDQYSTSGSIPNDLPQTDSEIYLGPQGGFMGEFGPWKINKELTSRLPDLLDRAKESERTSLRRQVLMEFLKKYPGEAAFKPENIAEAYRLLYLAFRGQTYEFVRGDRIAEMSHHLSLAIQNKEFTLEALTKENYAKRYHQLRKKLAEARGKPYVQKEVDHQGHFFGPRSAETLNNGNTIILLTRPDLSFSLESAADGYAEMLGTGVHEGTHFFEAEKSPKRNWTEGAQIKEEGTTSTNQLLWTAQHGDTQTLRQYLQESPLGYGVKQLDSLEESYRKYWEDSRKPEWQG